MQPLTLSMRPQVEAHLAGLRAVRGVLALSDWSFANLWLFRRVHQYRLDAAMDWPVICGWTRDGVRHALPLFDVAHAPAARLHILAHAHGSLYPLDTWQAQVAQRAGLRLACHAGDADYLYPAEHFTHWPGRALGARRRMALQLLAACGAEHLHQETFCRTRHAAPCAQVLRAWLHERGQAADGAECRQALHRAAALGLEGLVFFVRQQAAGFVLVQELRPGLLVVRFAKGLDGFIGIYPWMFRQLCLHFARPVQWLNFEQDMGHPGLRRSKQAWQPMALLRKWRAFVS